MTTTIERHSKAGRSALRGWGYGQCRAAVTIRKRTPGAKLSRWREGRNE